MSYHNEDIAACTNDKCARRFSCLRWVLGLNKDPYQTYVITDASECGLYIEEGE